jgi:hypothetical protein
METEQDRFVVTDWFTGRISEQVNGRYQKAFSTPRNSA